MTVTRATQHRAWFVQPGGILRGVWWIADPTIGLVALADEAAADVADVLVERHLQLDGPAHWSREHGAEETLVLDVLVQSWLDPRRDGARRATTPDRSTS